MHRPTIACLYIAALWIASLCVLIPLTRKSEREVQKELCGQSYIFHGTPGKFKNTDSREKICPIKIKGNLFNLISSPWRCLMLFLSIPWIPYVVLSWGRPVKIMPKRKAWQVRLEGRLDDRDGGTGWFTRKMTLALQQLIWGFVYHLFSLCSCL